MCGYTTKKTNVLCDAKIITFIMYATRVQQRARANSCKSMDDIFESVLWLLWITLDGCAIPKFAVLQFSV